MNKLRILLTWGLLLVATHAMGVIITVDPVEIEPGKSAEIIINLSNTETTLTGYQMSLYLPDGVTVQKKTNGKYKYTLSGRHEDSHQMTVKDDADGSLLLVCFSVDKDLISGTSGELLRLPIDVASTVTTSLQAELKNIKFSDTAAQGYMADNVAIDLNFPDVLATGISLDKTSLLLTAAGQTATLTANVIPSNATNKNVTWSSSNTAVATVSSTGVVTAVANGTADITATTTDGTHLSAMCNVTVSIPILVTDISLNQTSLSFHSAGQTATLSATVLPNNATNKNVTWSSSNTAVATVSSIGVVTAIGNGMAVITATTADGTNLSATCEVTVAIDASPKIVFADANVKTLCIQNWDTNGDGELSEAEAAEVTSIGAVFRNSMTITSFDELQYFTGLTEIGQAAFFNCSSLTSVSFPTGITTIHEGAFEGCTSLISVGLPNSVTSVANLVFKDCSSLTSVVIPNSVTSIGYQAFAYCTALTSVLIPRSVTFIGNHNDGVFKGCSSLTSIVVEEGNAVYDSRENSNAIIETASNTLICGCSNTIIPTTVKNIGVGAFSMCTSLTSLIVPSSVTTIGANAFSGCTGLVSIILPSSVTSIGESAFYGCTSLTSVAIPNGVTNIGRGVFSHCSGLTSISIPESMSSIPGGLFEYCDGLISVTIPNWVRYIYGGFNNCSGLRSVYIPKSVTVIEDYTFYGCDNLTAVYVEWDEPICLNSSDVFTNYSNATLYVPEGTKALYEVADYWKDFKEIVERTGSAITSLSELSNNKLYMLTTDQNVLSIQDKTVWINGIIGDTDHKGLVTDASQLSSPWTEPTEGSLEALLDGNTETFWHSNWSNGDVAGHTHYLQVDLVEPVSEDICMVFTRRNANNDHITQWDVLGSNAPEGPWTEIARISTPYTNKYETLISYAFDTFGFRYLRFYIDDTTGDGNGTRGYGHLSEFRLYKASEVNADVRPNPTPNERNQFAILTINGKYYLYSPALHAYYMIDTQFIPGYGSSFAIEDGLAGDDYRWTLSAMMNKNNCILGSQVRISATSDFDPTEALAAFTENVDLGLEDGYYRIRNARVFTNTVTDLDGSEKEVQVYKYACSSTDTEGNLYGSWCTPDVLETDCPSLWKLTNRNGLYDLQNMYTNGRFTTIDQSVKTTMSVESESLIAIDRVTEVDGVKYVNIRMASQPMADYNYLHTSGHENGMGINGEIVGWCNTGIYGNSEWILEPVDEAQAEAIINNYHKMPGDVNRDGLITIADVTALVNIILGKDSVEPYQYDHRAADVNKDGSITIADVTALVNIILGKN